MLRATLSTAALIALLAPANAADNGCDKFAWSLAHERALFAAADKPVIDAGTALPAMVTGAFVLHLQPDAQAAFAMPPERKPKVEHWFGGMVRLPAPEKPGVYQVTLSDEAWIDVVQDGRYARAVGNTGRGDCPGLRKSVQFELTAAPFVLQLSGAVPDRITIAIGARE